MVHSSIYKLFDFIRGPDRNKQKIRVLIYGLPKSGTSLLTYMIAESIDGSVKIEFEPTERNKKLEKSNNVVTKCLFDFNRLITPQKINDWNEFEKKIWLARDPRDIIISDFLYIWYWRHNPDKNNFEKALIKLKEKEKNNVSVPFHELEFYRHTGEVWSLEELISYHQQKLKSMYEFVTYLDNSWFIYKYEDIIDQRLKELSNYLGFEVNKRASVPSEFSRVVRSKTYSNWKNWFTSEDLQFYKPLMKDYMDLIGYDSNDWDLNIKQELKPEIGSEYMMKLFYDSNI